MDNDAIQGYLESRLIKNKESFVVDLVKDSIRYSLKRLILPSIEREIRSELTERAEKEAIKTFSTNTAANCRAAERNLSSFANAYSRASGRQIHPSCPSPAG